MKLYHGSVSVVNMPEFGVGNRRNDYGQGFYCTEHIELAKEWACFSGKDGFVNCYNLGLEGLAVFDLTRCHILNWMAILYALSNLPEDATVITKDSVLS